MFQGSGDGGLSERKYQFGGAVIHCRRFSSRRPADKEIETDAHRTHLVQRGFLRVGETTPFGFLPRQMPEIFFEFGADFLKRKVSKWQNALSRTLAMMALIAAVF